MVYVMILPRATTRVRVVLLAPPEPLVQWCRRTNHRYALTGGFFSRATGRPLGRLWRDGTVMPSAPWGGVWADHRGAVHILDDQVTIGPLGQMPSEPTGDLLTAGPMVVRDYKSLITIGYHFEGIPRTWQGELDADWTGVRAQRSAIGINRTQILAVACDGPPVDAAPDPANSGLTIAELARILEQLGARDALNLDGGGGTSMVYEQRLVNQPRAGSVEPGYRPGELIAEGRPLRTALTFLTDELHRTDAAEKSAHDDRADPPHES
jgi:exopolysaccharide biosynthesis protein